MKGKRFRVRTADDEINLAERIDALLHSSLQSVRLPDVDGGEHTFLAGERRKLLCRIFAFILSGLDEW